jgi:hypothetical protein
MPVDSTDIAWLAGIIDGEGNVGIYNRYACVQITNNDSAIIQRAERIIQTITNCSSKTSSSKRLNRWNRTYWLHSRGGTQSTHLILTTVLPYLTGRKRQIAEKVLAFTSSRLKRGISIGKPRLNQHELALLDDFRTISKVGDELFQ